MFSFSPCKLTQLKSCISGQNMPLSYELLSYCIKLLQYCPYTFIYPFILFAILSFSPIINIFPYVLLLSLRRNNADCVLKNFCNRIHICHCVSAKKKLFIKTAPSSSFPLPILSEETATTVPIHVAHPADDNCTLFIPCALLLLPFSAAGL